MEFPNAEQLRIIKEYQRGTRARVVYVYDPARTDNCEVAVSERRSKQRKPRLYVIYDIELTQTFEKSSSARKLSSLARYAEEKRSYMRADKERSLKGICYVLFLLYAKLIEFYLILLKLILIKLITAIDFNSVELIKLFL